MTHEFNDNINNHEKFYTLPLTQRKYFECNGLYDPNPNLLMNEGYDCVENIDIESSSEDDGITM